MKKVQTDCENTAAVVRVSDFCCRCDGRAVSLIFVVSIIAAGIPLPVAGGGMGLEDLLFVEVLAE